MACERWHDGKIAIAGALEFKQHFDESQISWFENIEELNCADFDFIFDASQTCQVTMLAEGEKILIHDADNNMLSHLKSLISLLLDMKILDADFADIKSAIRNECTFKSLCTSTDDVKKNIETWIQTNLKDCNSSLLMHFQCNGISLVEITDIADRITGSIKAAEDDIFLSISGEVKDGDIKISFWYR